ncbi:MAG: hypothetical protein OEW87_15190, partial [Flavobacteriaceae bacterium]|nr:hypothetical protein [Flavobacteriaceae bacterium]
MDADDCGRKFLEKQRKVHYKGRNPSIVSFEGPGRTLDPVIIYMREMGNIQLLTREGEIDVAKEIERGEEIIIKALSKTRFVHNEILSLEEELNEDKEIIQAVFDSSDGEFTKEKLEKEKKILTKINEIRKISTQLEKIPTSKKYAVVRGRLIVKMSRLIRELNLRSPYREKIIEGLRDKLKVIYELETSKQELKASFPKAKGKKVEEELKLRIKKIDKLLRIYKKEIGFNSQGLKKTMQTIAKGEQICDMAKKEFVTSNLRLVFSIAKKYSNYGVQFLDLVQEVNIGLMTA